MTKLSEWVRPDVEVAPWVLAEIKKLEEVCASKQKAIDSARTCAIKECAALFNSGVRNREMYINDVEELILGLIKENQND